jgi:hypothetical protein
MGLSVSLKGGKEDGHYLMAELWNAKLKGSRRFTVRWGRFRTCVEKTYEFHTMVKAAIKQLKYDPKR